MRREDRHQWWRTDLVNFVAVNLDCKSLFSFALTCRSAASNLRNANTIRYLASIRTKMLRGVVATTLEQLELAEAFANVKSEVKFKWGRVEISRSSRDAIAGSLRTIAKLLTAHPSLVLSIEAHCGLESRYHMHHDQAVSFTRARAIAVKSALMEECACCGITSPLDESQIKVIAWGCDRPLYWAWREGYGETPVDPKRSARNRRVEFYLSQKDGSFEIPQRRAHATSSSSAFAQSNRAYDGTDSDDEDDGDEEGGTGEEEEEEEEHGEDPPYDIEVARALHALHSHIMRVYPRIFDGSNASE